ncbi:MAG: hypothetical protein OEZ24_04130 [Candidatus Bathyarchaeota archaeon]|nr:hypothetical protein [Candidatus Bathyarchaeota archaeon]
MFRGRLVTTLKGMGKVLLIFIDHPILLLVLIIAVGILKSAVS